MKRAVLVICDGLRADLLSPERTPNLSRMASEARSFTAHRSVFPSTTRTTSASIATGCHPAGHGLQGNAVALDEGQGLVALTVGAPDFRDRLRRATGATLQVPTLAQRLASHGGGIVFSNVSPGAAYFQDPDGHGYVYHRDGSFGPGLTPIDRLAVSHDAAGDMAMTERFCKEVLLDRRPALAVLWQCEPDHSQHGFALGSHEHLAAVASADINAARVGTIVDTLNAGGEDILFIVASDHGHETVDRIIDLDRLLIDAGLKDADRSTDVVVASQGTSALVYLADHARLRLPDILRFLDGIASVYAGDALAGLGQRTDGALAIAVDGRKADAPNAFGINGLSDAFFDQFSTETELGNGQHGGLGRYEQNPFLIISGGGLAPGSSTDTPTSAVDIAPTILSHLGLPADGMDGRTLLG